MVKRKNDPGNSLAARLRSLMAERDLTQKAVGDAVGVSQAAVYKWLSGAMPGAGELYRLAKFFGRPMEWFVDGEKAARLEDTDWETSSRQLPAHKLVAILKQLGMTLAEWEKLQDEFDTGVFGREAMRFVLEGIIESHNKKGLTKYSESRKEWAVKSEMSTLLQNVARLTEPRGRKAELAEFLGVSQARISEWLAGKYEPGGETTLRLFRWVEQQERQQQKSPGSAAARPEPKAQRNEK